MSDLKAKFSEALRTATHDQDLPAMLCEIAEEHYNEAKASKESTVETNMSPSQEAALRASETKK